MKRIILVLLLTKALLFSSDIYLKDFVNIISTSLNITIVIDNDVNNQLSIFVADDLNKDSYLKILAEILNENDLTIKSFNSFYLITKVKKNEEIAADLELKELRTIQLSNIDFEYIKDLFTVYKDIEFTYIKTSKLIIINSLLNDFNKINDVITNIDKSPNQLKLKITILDTNLNKIKEYGSEIIQNINLNPSSNFFFNLLAYPFSVNSQVNTNDKSNFNSFIKLLNQNKITELVASPTLTLLDSKEVVFNVVKNIPYLSGSTTVEDTNSKTTNSYTYKDIGLKISITPKIFNENIFLDLDLTTESILDNSQTPTTSKSFINQSFTMNKNKLFVLTGINQTQKYNDLQSTPFLSDIPLLGWLFKSDEDNYSTSNLTIVFELINEDEYTSNDFNVVVPVDFKSNKDLEHQKRVNEILGVSK
jgi:general secretion pathway protein D